MLFVAQHLESEFARERLMLEPMTMEDKLSTSKHSESAVLQDLFGEQVSTVF